MFEGLDPAKVDTLKHVREKFGIENPAAETEAFRTAIAKNRA